MNTIRTALGAIIMAVLGLGYAASQRAYFAGEAPQYAEKVDTPAVRMLAMVALLVVIALAFVPRREADEE